MRRKRGWKREREGEGGRENLRLDGVSPALSLTSAHWRIYLANDLAPLAGFNRRLHDLRQNNVSSPGIPAIAAIAPCFQPPRCHLRSIRARNIATAPVQRQLPAPDKLTSGRIMSKKKLFGVSTAFTTCAMLLVLYIHRPGSRPVPVLVSEAGSVYVSPQISLRDIGFIARRYRINRIVDMRPDGEAPDEPSHLQMEQAAKAEGMVFSYIPVPHESIPPATVDALGQVLLSRQKPVVLYCRTGRRAVRTFALLEA
jgi:uncharacterized protein (TIGR01244 family)